MVHGCHTVSRGSSLCLQRRPVTGVDDHRTQMTVGVVPRPSLISGMTGATGILLRFSVQFRRCQIKCPRGPSKVGTTGNPSSLWEGLLPSFTTYPARRTPFPSLSSGSPHPSLLTNGVSRTPPYKFMTPYRRQMKTQISTER